MVIMSQELWKSCHIMSSDEDQPIVEDLYVGFDTDMRLVVELKHTDYEESGYNCSVSAVVEKDDAFGLSRKWNVPMTRLPEVIVSSVAEYTETVNAGFREVQACFKAVTEYLITEQCPYRIVRQYGRQGYICC